MSIGFADSRANVIAAVERMGIAVCSYSHETWSPRCDCKYGVADVKHWPTASEKGNGCPELRSLHAVIEALTDDEWSLLVLRAGGVSRGAIAGAGDIAARLHRADAAASMAQAQIAAVREALGTGQWS